MFAERRITQNIWHSKDQTKDHSMWMEWGIVLRWSTCLAQARPGSISSTARKKKKEREEEKENKTMYRLAFIFFSL